MHQHSPLLLQSRRGPRNTFRLDAAQGVYALFLQPHARLPGIEPREGGLIYIGMAGGNGRLAGRRHFAGRTVNHSPRKSLAVLLMADLALDPMLVVKPNAPSTWGLDARSDATLSGWMHENLHLAVEVCRNPAARETALIGAHAPPLHLSKCVQTPQHARISAARREMMARLASQAGLCVPQGII